MRLSIRNTNLFFIRMIRLALAVLLQFLSCALLSGCVATSSHSLSPQMVSTSRGPRSSGSAPHYILKRLNGRSSDIRLLGVYYAARGGAVINYTDDKAFACHQIDDVVLIPWADIDCISIKRDNSMPSCSVVAMDITTSAQVVHSVPLIATAWGGVEFISSDKDSSMVLRFDEINSVCRVVVATPNFVPAH